MPRQRKTDAQGYAPFPSNQRDIQEWHQRVIASSRLGQLEVGDAIVSASSTVGPVTLNKKYGGAGIVSSAALHGAAAASV